MKNKIGLVIGAVLMMVIAGIFHVDHPDAGAGDTSSRNPPPAASPPATPVQTAILNPAATVEPSAETTNGKDPSTLAAAARTGQSTALKPKKRAGQKPPIQDPTARAALSFVGADPDAEAYWVQAINNPSLPAEERKDLIEDLNEDGLSDPHHPAPEDMPLIASRIQMIEDLAPDAMDQVNARAFGEAYKDLLNLYNGQPAQ